MKILSMIPKAGLCLFILISLYGTFGCGNATEKQPASTVEEQSSQTTGEATQPEETKTVLPAEWPAEAPKEVPVFNFGTITETTPSETPNSYVWALKYQNVPADALKRYEETLKAAGFSIFRVGDENNSVGGEKPGYAVSVMRNNELVVVAVSKEKK